MIAAITAVLALSAWLYLLAARGGYWHAERRLPPPPHLKTGWPPVVVVVPARNEADVLPETLPSLIAQDYAGPMRVFVVDDHSGDDTAGIVGGFATAAPDRVSLIQAEPLVPGWTGKLWAMDQGLRHALAHQPDAAYVWFTDADIRHAPDALSALVMTADTHDRQLVSTMALLRSAGVWAGLLIPAFVYFFQKLYPFRWVSDAAKPQIAGAAGGCVLVRRETLHAAGGLAAIRDQLIDDCALARAIRDAGGRLWLGLTETTVSVRPYATLQAVWDMVARTAFTQLNHSVWMLLGTVIGMLVLYLAPPLAVVASPWLGPWGWLVGLTGLLGWVVMAITYRPTLALYGRPMIQAFTLPLCGALYTAMTVDSALRHWRGHGGHWKGRVQAGGAAAP